MSLTSTTPENKVCDEGQDIHNAICDYLVEQEKMLNRQYRYLSCKYKVLNLKKVHLNIQLFFVQMFISFAVANIS